jgi:hypothetical protein
VRLAKARFIDVRIGVAILPLVKQLLHLGGRRFVFDLRLQRLDRNRIRLDRQPAIQPVEIIPGFAGGHDLPDALGVQPGHREHPYMLRLQFERHVVQQLQDGHAALLADHPVGQLPPIGLAQLRRAILPRVLHRG